MSQDAPSNGFSLVYSRDIFNRYYLSPLRGEIIFRWYREERGPTRNKSRHCHDLCFSSEHGAEIFLFYLVPNGLFSGIVHSSRLAAGLFPCFLVRGPQGGGVDSTVQALSPAGIRGPCSTWSKSRDPASNSGDGVPLPKRHPEA